MRTKLTIGEAARLLGITPKAIRHYHKVGMLPEPERTASDYRLYGAVALLRLQRIRRLQAMGLPLKRIREVLDEADTEESEGTLRDALTALKDDLDAQIAALTSRRERVHALLKEGASAALDRAEDTPAILVKARDRLIKQGVTVPDEIWDQDCRIFGVLDGFRWPETYHERMRHASEFFTSHPELATGLVPLAQQLAAVASLPEDAPEVERLAEEIASNRAVARLLASIEGDDSNRSGIGEPDPKQPFDTLLPEIMMSTLAPAQRRLLLLMRNAATRVKEDTP